VTTTHETDSNDPARHRGPSLVAVATTYIVLFLAGLVVSTVMAGGAHFPSPFGPAAESARYFAEHGRAVQLLALLQFGAAVPFGIFAATATSRVQFLGRKVAGIHIALVGGVGAALALGASAAGAWVLSQPGIAAAGGVTRALHLACFAAGGPGYVVPFGLLVAGLAVTAGLQGLVPRWLMGFGLAVAAVAELSCLVLLVPAAAYLLPLARFTGFVWMLCFSVVVPKSKPRAALRTRAATEPLVHDAPQS
jgi:hypothetical protein